MPKCTIEVDEREDSVVLASEIETETKRFSIRVEQHWDLPNTKTIDLHIKNLDTNNEQEYTDLDDDECCRQIRYTCDPSGDDRRLFNGLLAHLQIMISRTGQIFGDPEFLEAMPAELRDDYQAAYSVLDINPNSSATQSRRCLETMIRHRFGLKAKRKSLCKLIEAVKRKVEKVEPDVLIRLMHDIRKLGGKGAHEKKGTDGSVNVSRGAATASIIAIEYLILKLYPDVADQLSLNGPMVWCCGSCSQPPEWPTD